MRYMILKVPTQILQDQISRYCNEINIDYEVRNPKKKESIPQTQAFHQPSETPPPIRSRKKKRAARNAKYSALGQLLLSVMSPGNPCHLNDLEDIAEAHGHPRGSVSGTLSRLRDAGDIVHLGNGKSGLWMVPKEEQKEVLNGQESRTT